MISQQKLLKEYENMPLVRYDEIQNYEKQVAYSQLPNHYIPGVLKCNQYVNGELMQVYSAEDNNIACIAGTRMGKSTSYVIPIILSFARQKIKRSMLVSDPKCELYRLTASTLRELGYNVKLFNFRDYMHSECWNPLTPLFRKYRKAMSLADDEVELVKTERGLRNSFRGVIYDDQKELDSAIKAAKDVLLTDVDNDIYTLAHLLIEMNSDEKFWDIWVYEVFEAFLWAMLEDSNKEENPITEETFSFSTIITLMQDMKARGDGGFSDDGYFSDRDVSSMAYQRVNGALLSNAPRTSSCVFSMFGAALAKFRESVGRLITSCNSFDMSELLDKPTIVFISYRDELRLHYDIISLFIKDVFAYLVQRATDNNLSGKLDVPFYFILDEFGNFSAIESFNEKISTCAGRNIFFILILQSYAQLDNVYGKNNATTIRSNLNVHIFFGSNDPDTLEQISRECLKRTRLSPQSAINGDSEEIKCFYTETLPNVPISMLAHLEPGECIITEANLGYVMFSKLVRYYLIDEMKNLPLSSEKEYVCPVNVFDKKYFYTHGKVENPHRQEKRTFKF